MARRRILASRDIATKMLRTAQKKVQVYSFFPVDKASCVCHAMIHEWKEKLSMLPRELKEAELAKQAHLECPKDKTNMDRYEITCSGCGQVQGYCYATDETLKDWCDFHYVQWTDGKEWFGNLTPNISPIDETLGLECTCGVDTRDMRGNMTLPVMMAHDLEKDNRRGREFGQATSKFKVRKVSLNTVRFNKPNKE